MPLRRCEKAKTAAKLGIGQISNILYGTIPSKLRGAGLEYVDFREYHYGDDVKFVDWRLSARSPSATEEYKLYVKEFLAERIINNIMVLDYTSSMDYGDKIETSIYALTGLLVVAHMLEDMVDLVVLRGEKPILYLGINPLDAIILAVNTVCRLEPSGSSDLRCLTALFRRLRKRRAVFLITDYAHSPIELEEISSYTKIVNSKLAVIVSTTSIETNPPTKFGFYAFYDPEKQLFLDTDISEFYKQVRQHVTRIKSVLVKTGTDFLELRSLEDAKIKKIKLLRLYLGSRLLLRA